MTHTPTPEQPRPSDSTGASPASGTDADTWAHWLPEQSATPPDDQAHPARRHSGFPPGAQVIVREEQWLVRKSENLGNGDTLVEVTGVSPFVRDIEAVFYDKLDHIQLLDPHATTLVPDRSANHSRARLYLEALIRKSFLPQTEHGLALADNFLMDSQRHQLRPAELALSMANPQPRLLIADVVGLGKTLEIGLLLAELIRRGRGERILVVSPQHVLEQFQRELWTRFSIPLVRLDSAGIQRAQQEIPSGRNPFAYFKRVIVSVDTLKNKNLYAHHLENTRWDAVVIDESHNLISRGSERNALARLLAPRTDALILASATPHNGDPASFAELIRLLDPAAIADPHQYEVKDLLHLYIRRTKTSPEVRESLQGAWATRGPSLPVHAPAGEKEQAVLAELADRWIPREETTASVSGHQLFPYTLLKSFLSSHHALLATVTTRQNSIAKSTDPAARAVESAALEDLRALAARIEDRDSAKLAALVAQLRALGVGPGSDTRVVVFSESVPTLTWLGTAVPAALGFPVTDPEAREANPKKPWLAYGGTVQVMHGDANSDEEQQKIVSDFGLQASPLRVLLTGDIASEGVNLHHQCHQLIHYDLPWSLIRIEQRNGRIDRYGQQHSPEFRALILTSDVPWRTDPETGEPRPLDDRLVGEKLLAREEHAHRIDGTAEAVTGLYRAKEEDDRLTKDLIAGRTVEQSIDTSRRAGPSVMAGLLGRVEAARARGAEATAQDVPRAEVPSLFDTSADYFDAAIQQVCDGRAPEDVLVLRREPDGTIAFQPPADLQHRFRDLPRSYLREQGVLPSEKSPGRLRITFDKALAGRRLKAALDSADTQWPNVSYVSDVHPVLDWLTDKVLVAFGRNEAPVLSAPVPGPVFLVQGIYSNALGRPTVVEWIAVTATGEADGSDGTPPMAAERMDNTFLARCGVTSRMPGRAATPDELAHLQRLVPGAMEAALGHLREREAAYARQIEDTLAPYRKRVTHWKQEAIGGTARHQAAVTADERLRLVKSMETSGEPMLRLMAVLHGPEGAAATR
ncbi:SNF2-related protein [Streptomyces harbinensis]|uniref:SNF2-related protein n=1 Tax=Streptomyces harbinensis TaxID=1176198 RepID=UPI0034DE309D